MLVLDGRVIEKEETIKLKQKVDSLVIKPKLGIIQVGDLFESNKYINNKLKKSSEIGIEAKLFKFEENISESELIEKISEIKKNYDGLIVQLPLPSHINKQNVLDSIDLEKDIDGLSNQNMNNFYNNICPYFVPATAKAILMILDYYNIEYENKKIMVIGESNLVGKPIRKILSNFSNYVESRNKKTGIEGSENFDILIVATGNPGLIKHQNVKNNSVIIDVGINRLDNKKVVGDVDFESVSNKVSAITPVPGGVGPLTVICLLKNLVDKF